MKLFELTGIKHLKNKTPAEIIDYLESHENTTLKRLGNGANGIAFSDGKVAYKFWHRDSAYEHFIDYALKHQDNLCVPKLYSRIKTLPFNIETDGRNGIETGIKYIKMEILKPTNDSTIKVISDTGAKRLGLLPHEAYLQIHTAFTYPSKRKNIESGLMYIIDKVTKNKFSDTEPDPTINPFSPDFIDIFESGYIDMLKTTSDIVQTLPEMSIHYPDLHGGNFMMRGDQLVLIDPLANTYDLQINSIFRNDIDN